MERAVGLDGRLGLDADDLVALAPEVRRLGYTALWRPSGTDDPLGMCRAWHAASGLSTGVSVLPFPQPDALADQALAVAAATDGTFVLGVGSGRLRDRPVAQTREALARLRGLLGGRVPVYLAALGPQMLRLAGQAADGVALNWCTPEHVQWSRERIGASIPVVSYIRVCVDDDIAAARRALGAQVVGYALIGTRDTHYRGHFTRMGFGDAIDALAERRAAGATDPELAGEVPVELLDAIGYAGPVGGLRAAFERLGRGLDVAILRVLSARPGSTAPVLSAIRGAVR